MNEVKVEERRSESESVSFRRKTPTQGSLVLREIMSLKVSHRDKLHTDTHLGNETPVSGTTYSGRVPSLHPTCIHPERTSAPSFGQGCVSSYRNNVLHLFTVLYM